jgi:hypothetical protein
MELRATKAEGRVRELELELKISETHRKEAEAAEVTSRLLTTAVRVFANHRRMYTHTKDILPTLRLLQERIKVAMEKAEREMEQRAAHDKFLLNQVTIHTLKFVHARRAQTNDALILDALIAHAHPKTHLSE